LLTYRTTSKVLSPFECASPNSLPYRAAEQFLSLSSFSTNEEFEQQTSDEIEFLANNGLINHIKEGIYMISPLHRNFFGFHIRKMLLPPMSFPPIPTVGLDLDYLKILICVMKQFSCLPAKHWQNLMCCSRKNSKIPKLTGLAVFKEEVYSQEFGSILRDWFLPNIIIVPEAGAATGEADFIVTSSHELNDLVIEFCASVNFGPESDSKSFLGNLKRAKYNIMKLKAEKEREVTYLLVHFIPVLQYPVSTFFDEPSTRPGKNAIAYVYHTNNWQGIDLFYWTGTQKIVYKNLAANFEKLWNLDNQSLLDQKIIDRLLGNGEVFVQLT